MGVGRANWSDDKMDIFRLFSLLVIIFCTVMPSVALSEVTKDNDKSDEAKAESEEKPNVAVAKSEEKLEDLHAHPPIPQHLVGPFTVTANIDLSYNYLSRKQFFTSGFIDRLYDQDPNGFTLQQAPLNIAYQPKEGFGTVLTLTLGRDANIINSYGLNAFFNSRNFALDLTQVILQYATDSFTFMVGKYFTLAGYEYVFTSFNANFSISLLGTFAQPATHTGVRTVYIVNDKVNLVFGINDGWDTIRDWSKRKTIELGSAYTGDKYAFSVYFYNGGERVAYRIDYGPVGVRTLVDFIASMKVTDKLTLVNNYTYVTQTRALLPTGTISRAVWQGIAGYASYQLNDKWRIAGRAEYFNDQNGYATGLVQAIKELTFTIGYQPLKQWELRAEARRDISNNNSYLDKNNVNTSNNLQSFAIESVIAL